MSKKWREPVEHFDLCMFELVEYDNQLWFVVKFCSPAKNSRQVVACAERKNSDLTLPHTNKYAYGRVTITTET